MKIVCVRNLIPEYDTFFEILIPKKRFGITVGNSYDVIYEGRIYYRIINDDDVEYEYSKKCFEDLNLFRNKIIDKFLEE